MKDKPLYENTPAGLLPSYAPYTIIRPEPFPLEKNAFFAL